MGWKSKFGKGAKAVGRGAKEVGKFAKEHGPDVAAVVAPPVVNKLLEDHGDKIGTIAGHVEQIAAAVDGSLITQEQADRIEAKLDGITAQIAELRHLILLQGHKSKGEGDE